MVDESITPWPRSHAARRGIPTTSSTAQQARAATEKSTPLGPWDYYALDSNLGAVVELHVSDEVMAWAHERLAVLGARCGTEVVRRAEVYDPRRLLAEHA